MAVEPSVTPVLVPVRVDVRPRARAIGVLIVALVAAAVVSAQAIGAWVLIDGYTGASAEPGAFLVLLALLAVNEALSVNVFDDGMASPGEVPVLAAGVLCGPLAVPALEVTVTLAGAIVRRQVNWWTFFNAGVFTLSGVAGAAVLAVAFAITSSPWLLLALGGVAGLLYFVVNGVLCALGAMVYWREPFRAFFARSLAWLAPYHVGYGVLSAALVLAHQAMGMVGLLVFAMPALAMLVSLRQYTRRTEKMVKELRVANQSLEHLLAENRGLLAAISRQHIATIRGLANAIDAKDPYTAGHTERVALYSAGIAEALGPDRGATPRPRARRAAARHRQDRRVRRRADQAGAAGPTTSGRRCAATRRPPARSSRASTCRPPSSRSSATTTRTSTAPAIPIA